MLDLIYRQNDLLTNMISICLYCFHGFWRSRTASFEVALHRPLDDRLALSDEAQKKNKRKLPF